MRMVLPFAAGLLSAAGAYWIMHRGDQLGLTDHPNERSSHIRPVPKGGGIGILLAFALAAWGLCLPWGLAIPAGVVSLMSFWGDKVELPATIRLIIQFLSAIIAFLALQPVHHHPVVVLILILPMAVFIVGTANVYNFMDGINGIAAITGAIAFLLLTIFGVLTGKPGAMTTFSITMIIACLGFLPFNFPNARVFMGDVGSILLGFLFASMVVWFSETLTDFLCLSGFLFPFYADALTTIAIRIRDGENITQAHRRHMYQLLANEMKIPHSFITCGYGAVQMLIGISLIIARHYNPMAVLGVMAFSFVIFLAASFGVRYLVETRN